MARLMEFGIVVVVYSTCVDWSAFGYLDIIDDDSFRRRFFFFFAVKLSWPLSVFESSLSDSLSDELELDEDDDELELLELSEAKPVASFKFTRSAISARSGSFSCNSEIVNDSIFFYPLEIPRASLLPLEFSTTFSIVLVDHERFYAIQLGNLFY